MTPPVAGESEACRHEFERINKCESVAVGGGKCDRKGRSVQRKLGKDLEWVWRYKQSKRLMN